MTNSGYHNTVWAIMMGPVIGIGMKLDYPLNFIQTGIGVAMVVWKLWLIYTGANT